MDHGADVDHAVDHDVDHGAEASGTPAGLSLLAFIGLGKAPLLVVLLIFFGSIGILGWILNSVVQGVFGNYPDPASLAVMPLSVIGGGLISSRTARFIGRVVPPVSTTATHAQTLVGRRGTVISPFVDEKYGLVHLRDQGGTLINVFAVIPSGEPIKRGAEVVLVSYDPQHKHYTVSSA
jgi:membrane protein implicated in regulation of membrane protease activity